MTDPKSGADVYPPLRATVPVGSSWVIHIGRVSRAAGYGTTMGEQVVNWLVNRPKHAFTEGFLLLTPRIAGQEPAPGGPPAK